MTVDTGFDLDGHELDEAAMIEIELALVVEAVMPGDRPRASSPGGAARSVALIAAGALVVTAYVGVPVALVARVLLQAAPNAVSFTSALLVLGGIWMHSVMSRTNATTRQGCTRQLASRSSRLHPPKRHR